MSCANRYNSRLPPLRLWASFRVPCDLTPVFETMLANAVQLCQAKFGLLYLYEDGALHTVASHNVPPALANSRKSDSIRPGPGGALGQAIRTKQTAHIVDLAATRAYAERDPLAVTAVELGGVRTVIAVPMLKDNEIIGIISIFRQEVRPFTDKQVALLANFAAQAVIAIENARLLNELRESLDQQTATASVLGVISSSPGELQPVYDAMLHDAVRLCDAKFGNIYRWNGDALNLVATHNTPTALIEARRRSPLRPHADFLVAQIIRNKTLIHIADLVAEPAYSELKPAIELGGIRTLLVVPMLKDDELIGVLSIYRQEVRPFTDKQIELVKNFAAQAVIAIENARLLNELRQRTTDLGETLDQQTATSEVLRVISLSAGELRPVFQAILENAVRICKATFGNLYLREDDGLRAAAMHNAPPAYAEQRKGIVHPSPTSTLGRAVQTKQPTQTPDITKLKAYVEGDPWLISTVSLGGYRAALAVPMLHDDELIGAIIIFRKEAGTFADKQIGLLTNFAKQAVIAIENARLLNELRQRTTDLSESLEQQTATSDILGVIS